MVDKKLRRPHLRPGFTAVANHRVNAAINSAVAVLAIANAALVKEGLAAPISARVIHDEAVSQVRAALPRAAKVFDWRNGLPTRNDNPEYRK